MRAWSPGSTRDVCIEMMGPRMLADSATCSVASKRVGSAHATETRCSHGAVAAEFAPGGTRTGCLLDVSVIEHALRGTLRSSRRVDRSAPVNNCPPDRTRKGRARIDGAGPGIARPSRAPNPTPGRARPLRVVLR